MRKPSEYVAAAKARLRGSLLPDCSEVLRHGERTAKVTRIGSPYVGNDPLTGDDVAEAVRVLAFVADFPALCKGEAVELGQTFRVVTSCRMDIAGAGYTVGLSAEFEKCPAAYSGSRRENGRVRQFRHPLDVLLLETGRDASYIDGIAPAMETSYTVAVRRADWPEATGPDPSDAFEVAPGGIPFTLRVASATRHDGWYIIKCRTRGGRNG